MQPCAERSSRRRRCSRAVQEQAAGRTGTGNANIPVQAGDTTATDLFLYDRKKEMIIRNGYEVCPPDVEAAPVSHPDVLLAAAVAPDDGVVHDNGTAYGQDIARTDTFHQRWLARH